MGYMKITPGKLEGKVKIPPSKSIAHRAVICAALANGRSIVENIDLSDDIIATISAMKTLGAEIEIKEDYVEIIGINSKELKIKRKEIRKIDCNESGSTLRFLVPISLLFDGKTTFIGKGNLGKRPLDTYYKIFDKDNVSYTYKKDMLDLEVSGRLKGGEYRVAGNISSQFITGLLFTLPLIEEDSKIVIEGPLESKGYIDLTLKVLKDYGIEIINNDYKEFVIKGNQEYKASFYRVEGDYSQGAFFLCGDGLGHNILVEDLKKDSLQGDKEVLDILGRMGVVLSENDEGIIGESNKTKGTLIDASQCPDIIPVLTALSSVSDGKTEIINAARLRIKECDRLHAITVELNKLGAVVTEYKDSLIIEGMEDLKGGVEVWSHKDHRIAMSLAIIGTVCRFPIIIKDFECVSKSYPNFFEDFRKLGGKANEWNMGE